MRLGERSDRTREASALDGSQTQSYHSDDCTLQMGIGVLWRLMIGSMRDAFPCDNTAPENTRNVCEWGRSARAEARAELSAELSQAGGSAGSCQAEPETVYIAAANTVLVLIEVGSSESHELINPSWMGPSGSGDPRGVQGTRSCFKIFKIFILKIFTFRVVALC